MIFRTPFFLPWLYPNLIWRIPVTEKEIYMTFDDGPVPGPTELVLDELAKVNARATFFCIGDNVRKHPDIFGKIVERGHTVGNHTFNHIKGWNFSVPEYVENARLCNEQFHLTPGPPPEGTGGAPAKLFRPPYGRIKRSQIKALAEYKIIMWDVLTFDYAKNISAGQCLIGSIKATRPGSIVVFHDSLKSEKKLEYVLPRFLRHFADLGYSFKAIPNS